MKLFIILGALNAMMAVGTGAFGAHGLQGKISDHYLSVWEKATTYQMYHGLALLIIGVISGTTPINVNWAGWLIFAGIIFFSGSLYILVLTQIKVLGAITPIGGVLFIIGWIMLIIATFKFAG
ncbi:TPA: DUF423 domain-containing protein [Staphylococcus aureus]|nr:DUF423 domain-containing protein [Staphylococcus aureus]